MRPEVIVKNRYRLVYRIEQASDRYPNANIDWATLHERIMNEYPKFNSHSFVEIECPVCHELHEVQLCHLYNGHFTCKSCQLSTKFTPVGQAAGLDIRMAAAHSPEVRRKAAITSGNIAKATVAACNPEVRRKAIQTQLDRYGCMPASLPESRSKAWSTRRSKK